MLAHRRVFVLEQGDRPVALVRLSGGEERFEEAIGAEADVGDKPRRVGEPLHRLRHLLRRSVRRVRLSGGVWRRRRRRRHCRSLLLHFVRSLSFSLTKSQVRTLSLYD